jgi:hypothetical protein
MSATDNKKIITILKDNDDCMYVCMNVAVEEEEKKGLKVARK